MKDIDKLPHWPRGLSRTLAASYVGVSPTTFTSTCAYRKLNPNILMVQSAQNRSTENASGCLDGT